MQIETCLHIGRIRTVVKWMIRLGLQGEWQIRQLSELTSNVHDGIIMFVNEWTANYEARSEHTTMSCDWVLLARECVRERARGDMRHWISEELRSYTTHSYGFNDWPINWLIDWLIDRSIDRSIHWLIDWLVGWLIDWLTDWLIDWLIDWLHKLANLSAEGQTDWDNVCERLSLSRRVYVHFYIRSLVHACCSKRTNKQGKKEWTNACSWISDWTYFFTLVTIG